MKDRRPLLVLFVGVAALKVGLMMAWGDRALLFDEESYRRAGEAAAGWLRGGLSTADLSGPGRIAWHNPGYGLVFTAAALLPGPAVLWVRLLQLVAGLLSGVLLARTLEPRVGSRWAAVAAGALWLHPSMLYFGVALWPVGLATLGTTALLFAGDRWTRRRDHSQAQWEFGIALAALPFFAAPALFLLPGVAALVGVRRWPRVLGPAIVTVGAWSFALSLALGTWVPFDLAGPRNLALGNNEQIADGRGSLWGDAENKEVYLLRLEEACGDSMDRQRLACEVRWCTTEARSWALAHPGLALEKASLRVLETWRPDTFLPRHLARAEQFPPDGLAELAQASRFVLAALQFAGLALLLLAILSRRRELRPLLLGLILWTLPAAMSVGLTRIRQPVWPWIVAAAILLLAPRRRP
jgi:hypothetical protein